MVKVLVVPVSVEPRPTYPVPGDRPGTGGRDRSGDTPVIVTFATLTVDVPAVRIAPLLTVKFPPVPVSARFAVDRVAALLRVRVAAHRIPFVAIVKVAAAVGLNARC